MSDTTHRRETQAVVIGGGPGGYACAIRLAQLGVKTLLVHKGPLGGVCLNIGCIPSKALIAASKLVEHARHGPEMGVTFGEPRIEVSQLMAWKDGVVSRLTGGIAQLLRANGAHTVQGVARFLSPRSLEVAVDGAERPYEVHFDHAIIATGSHPTEIPGFVLDEHHVVSSTGALAFERVPARLAVIGGGYIGMELGGAWQRLGSEVTIIEYAAHVLPGFERDVVRPVAKRFVKRGGRILTSSRAARWEPAPGGGLCVRIEDTKRGAVDTVEADVVLLTVGRRPNSRGLGLHLAGVQVDDKGFVVVDGAQRTNVPHIHAIGDVAGEPMLAHKATREGEVAAEVIAGLPSAFDARGIPAAVFTDPEIATVGLTATEAAAQGHEVRTGRFSFAANGRALSLGEAEGFLRLVFDAQSEILLGAQIVGPSASDLIAELGLALEMGAQATDIGQTIHAHPTLGEAVMEAANAALGHAIHAINR